MLTAKSATFKFNFFLEKKSLPTQLLKTRKELSFRRKRYIDAVIKLKLMMPNNNNPIPVFSWIQRKRWVMKTDAHRGLHVLYSEAIPPKIPYLWTLSRKWKSSVAGRLLTHKTTNNRQNNILLTINNLSNPILFTFIL